MAIMNVAVQQLFPIFRWLGVAEAADVILLQCLTVVDARRQGGAWHARYRLKPDRTGSALVHVLGNVVAFGGQGHHV